MRALAGCVTLGLGLAAWALLLGLAAEHGVGGVHPLAWGCLGLVGPFILAALWDHYRRAPRLSPRGYIGRFKRPDGVVVHIGRLPSGLYAMASDEQPPRDLGRVKGRDFVTWVKLAHTPDGLLTSPSTPEAAA